MKCPSSSHHKPWSQLRHLYCVAWRCMDLCYYKVRLKNSQTLIFNPMDSHVWDVIACHDYDRTWCIRDSRVGWDRAPRPSWIEISAVMRYEIDETEKMRLVFQILRRDERHCQLALLGTKSGFSNQRYPFVSSYVEFLHSEAQTSENLCW